MAANGAFSLASELPPGCPCCPGCPPPGSFADCPWIQNHRSILRCTSDRIRFSPFPRFFQTFCLHCLWSFDDFFRQACFVSARLVLRSPHTTSCSPLPVANRCPLRGLVVPMFAVVVVRDTLQFGLAWHRCALECYGPCQRKRRNGILAGAPGAWLAARQAGTDTTDLARMAGFPAVNLNCELGTWASLWTFVPATLAHLTTRCRPRPRIRETPS